MFRALMMLLLLIGCGSPRERARPSAPRLGSDAGASGDAGGLDAAGTDSVPACACELGERCIDGVCRVVDSATIYISAHSSQQLDGAIDWTYGGVSACFNEPSGEVPNWPPVPLAMEGPCVVNEYHADDVWTFATQGARRDAGDISISGGMPSPILLELDPNADTCYRHGLPSMIPPIFTGGPLSISATGGPDFPAFSGSIPTPDLLAIETGAVSRSGPIIVEWTGTNSAAAEIFFFVRAIAGTDSTDIQCTVPDTGSFAISTALAMMLPADATTVVIRAERQIIAVLEPSGSDVSVILITTSGATRSVSYAP